MGIIRAAASAFGSVFEEQWKEFVTCDAMGMDTLMCRGYKRISDRSTNTRKDDNVLTNGSVLLVSDGQCVIVVSRGKVVDVCTEPGEHIFIDPSRPGGIRGFLSDVGTRMAFGGGDIQPITHRIYYVNMLECMDNPYFTPAPVAFRIHDPNTDLDIDMSVFAAGLYSYRISDPAKFYKLLAGNIGGSYTREKLTEQITSLLLTALGPALSRISEQGIRPYQAPEHIPELCNALREEMNGGWCGEHGLEIVSLALDSFAVEGMGTIQTLQKDVVLQDVNMAAATITGATANAMQTAAANGAGGMMAAALIAPQAEPGWVCSCGAVSRGLFCPECGRRRSSEWICACGQKNSGRFCSECGRANPFAPKEQD